MKNTIKNFVKKFKKYYSTNILFLTYSLTSLIIGTLLRALTMGLTFDFRPFIWDLVIILIFGSFGYLFKPKNQFKYFLSVNIVFTLICVVNSIYYMFYTNYVSVSLLSTMSMFGQVSDSVTTKLRLEYFVYLLAPITLIVVNKLLVKKNYYYNVGKEEKGKLMFRRTGVCALILGIMIGLTMTKSDGSKLVKLWNRDAVVKRFGIYTYMLSDMVTSLTPAISPMFGYDESAHTFLEFYSKDRTYETNKYTNIFEDKNVIFIHMESIQNFLIDLKVNGVEITPNINKLSREGMYFSKFYPQISIGTSSDTEFTLSTGLLPSSSGTVFVNYFNRKYESMERAFDNKGYYTFSMHANVGDYWNRKNMYNTLGYKEYFDKSYFEVPTDKKSEDLVGLGLSDKSFFKQIIPILKNIKESNTKYMGKIITLSNHSPFDDVTKYGNIDLGYLNDTEMGNYLKSVHYADEALGVFFKLVKENGLDEDTVFILYGDHESKLGKKNLNLLYNYDEKSGEYKNKLDPTYVDLDNYQYDILKNTPLIIYTSNGIINGEVKDVMGMWDVFPTVANMFNLSYKYPLGNDIFSRNDKIVVFPNGDIITNKVFYNNLRDEYVSLTLEPISSEYIDQIKLYAEVRLEVSKGIIVHNLISTESEKLERIKR